MKPLRIPRRLQIGGTVYTVEYKDLDSYEGGNIDFINSKIILDKTLGRQQTQRVFLHEVLHAIDESYNNGKLDERTTDRLGHGLHQFIREMGWID
jgi:nitrate reductase beta subunit